jgi:eukaryotic-like serine/threonine-protein kinase
MINPLPEDPLRTTDLPTPTSPDVEIAVAASQPPGVTQTADFAGAALPVQEPAPETLGRFVLTEEIGRGGMGSVWRGHDPSLGRDLAIKVLLAQHADRPESCRRFLDEARITGQLEHPGVPPVHELDRAGDGRPYFAMKLIRGQTLGDLLKARPDSAHELPRFIAILEQIAQTLAYAHAHGVIHRDLKPANIMVGKFGEVQVMDWGLAKPVAGQHSVGLVATTEPNGDVDSLAGPQSTQSGTVLGTPAYMAPEQARGQIDRLDQRTDVFGLGAILCQILTGRPPFQGAGTLEVITRASMGDLSEAYAALDSSGADRELIDLAKTCLAPEQAERPHDAGAVVTRLIQYRTGVEERLRRAEAERASAQVRAEAERKRRRLVTALAGALVLLIAGGGTGAWLYWSDRNARAAELNRRRADTERELLAAIEQAEAPLRQARAQTADPVQVKPILGLAHVAVERARAALSSGVAEAAWRQRVEALAAEVESEERDRQFVAELDEIHLKTAGDRLFPGSENEVRTARDAKTADLYWKTFGAHGLDLAALVPEEAAALIRQRAAWRELLAYVLAWNQATPKDSPISQRLDRVAIALAPELNGFRGADRAELLRLMATPEVQALPPAVLAHLSKFFQPLRADSERLTFLRDCLRHHPGDFRLNAELAVALHWAAKPDLLEAVRYFTAALAVRDESSALHMNLGIALQDLKRYDEALAEYLRAEVLNPTSGSVQHNLGVLHQRCGRLAEATTHYQRATELKSQFPGTYTGLVGCLVLVGKLDEALAAADRFRAVWPKDAHSYLSRGLALATLGRIPEAESMFGEAVRRDPRCEGEAAGALGSAYLRLGRFAEAEVQLRRASKLWPESASVWNNLAVALSNLGRSPEAESSVRQAIALQSDFGLAHVTLGLIMIDQKKPAEAEAALREGLRLAPDNAEGHYQLAELLFNQRKFAEALPSYRRSCELKADVPERWINLGCTLISLNEPAEGEQALRKALALRSDSSKAQYNLGLALMRQNKPAEAEAAYREAIRISSDYDLAHWELGWLLYKQARYREALPGLRRGIENLSGRLNWKAPSKEWVAQVQRLAELQPRLPAIVSRKDPLESADFGALMHHCSRQQQFAAAARLCDTAFKAHPELANDFQRSYRYNAACHAARAGVGLGEGAASFNQQECADLRQLAFDWMQADLAHCRKLAASGKEDDLADAQKRLDLYKKDPDLVGVRDPAALERLPEPERDRWRQFWADAAKDLLPGPK